MNQVARFIVSGAVNTLLSYAVYAALLHLGMAYAWANLAGLVFGVIFSFKTQGRWVFGNTDNRRFVRFVATWTVLYGVSVGIIGALTAHGMNGYLAGALAQAVTSVLSFFAQKRFVYRKTPVAPHA